MITLLIGKKGSGKTKKLIELANEAVQNSNGNVVVIEKGLKLTYDISHKARLVDSDAYGIEGLDALVGFVSGICAANYDVTDVFVDSTLKITGKGVEEVEPLTAKLKALSLDVPPAVDLALRLREKNIDIPEGILTIDDMVAYVCR